MDSEWLRGLKPGDEVAVLPWNQPVRICKIKSVTANYVRAGGWQFRRVDGWQTGSELTRAHIEPATQENRNNARRAILVSKLRIVRWQDLPLATLERVVAALEGGDDDQH